MTKLNIFVIIVLAVNALFWGAGIFVEGSNAGARFVTFMLCILSLVALIAAAQA